MFYVNAEKKILSTKSSFEKKRLLIQTKPSILRSPNFWNDFLLADNKVKKQIIDIASKVSEDFLEYRWAFEDEEFLKRFLKYNESYLLFLEAKIDKSPEENIQKLGKKFEADADEMRKIFYKKQSTDENAFKKSVKEIPIDLF